MTVSKIGCSKMSFRKTALHWGNNLLLLPTAYVVRREVMFSQVSVCSGGGGYPGQVQMRGYPIQVQTNGVNQSGPDGEGGVTQPGPSRGYPGQGWGTLTWHSARSRWGKVPHSGMPLVVTQEDFLVWNCSSLSQIQRRKGTKGVGSLSCDVM